MDDEQDFIPYAMKSVDSSAIQPHVSYAATAIWKF